MKVAKFIKDPDVIEDVMRVLRKYFKPLKDQYVNCIGMDPKMYPVIGWLDYARVCE